MAIEHNTTTGKISLSQKAYLTHVLEQFGMSNCNLHSTPLPTGIQLTKEMCPKTEDDKSGHTPRSIFCSQTPCSLPIKPQPLALEGVAPCAWVCEGDVGIQAHLL